jgi:two-component system, chemotaxis family, protein-glutamate methylesterase/glutaminase
MPAIARVLVVDDSLTMRALFSSVLERSRDIVVVGMASSADEARQLIPELKPNVLTLDVEMPGMNGLEFLAELMETRPIPVVMLSTLTQKGATTSLKAYELGAVECFPKPMKATPDEFDKIAGKLGKLVVAASQSNVSAPRQTTAQSTQTAAFEWDGRPVGISVSTGGVDALMMMLTAWPVNCPPTIVVLPIDPELVKALAAKLDSSIAPSVRIATDGEAAEQGTIYFACDPLHHVVIDTWPDGRLRMIDRDPVKGARPSANMLFGSMAKAGGGIGVIMSGMGDDGAAGIKLLRDAGGRTLAQDAASSVVHEAASAAIALGGIDQSVSLDQLAGAVLAACNTAKLAS